MKNKRYRVHIDATIDSIGKIDNKLPICEFMDNLLFRIPSTITILTYNIEGEPQINMLDFDGEKITFIKNRLKDNELITIESYSGDNLVKERNKNINYIDFNLYDNNNLVMRTISYRK